ncbi:hypothetical protein Pse7367_3950 (plasmid) [Thalassoporum mexicanum PCC 7367]|uniref:DUF4278 domain-containing protein n=1 Tax=Thalassoporum mexicanum TaxID=3457544 RepID=UPI00029FD529|nr:DUF4278 domain-containing protein [Pseudanabaena sp. PCC 7367]AFY72165.1 hypothetical protein Pse7367_3950 [Pseudanabaena sp. PCC 7367]
MKLTYRGIAYNSHREVLATTKSRTDLNFMGAHYRMAGAEKAASRRTEKLMFMGVAY